MSKNKAPEIEQLPDAYVVYTNTDLTEGRGYNYPLHVCKMEATAIRLAKRNYVQGTDAPIIKMPIFKFNNRYYGPVVVCDPTEADTRMQIQVDATARALEKAKAAGLTDEEIAALRVYT